MLGIRAMAVSTLNKVELKPLKYLLSDTLVYGISSVIARFINYLFSSIPYGLFNPEAYGMVMCRCYWVASSTFAAGMDLLACVWKID